MDEAIFIIDSDDRADKARAEVRALRDSPLAFGDVAKEMNARGWRMPDGSEFTQSDAWRLFQPTHWNFRLFSRRHAPVNRATPVRSGCSSKTARFAPVEDQIPLFENEAAAAVCEPAPSKTMAQRCSEAEQKLLYVRTTLDQTWMDPTTRIAAVQAILGSAS